jgi:hypothetical protein
LQREYMGNYGDGNYATPCTSTALSGVVIYSIGGQDAHPTKVS